MEFDRYQHIERLGTVSVEGILDGTCHIFYKIDGTNSQVYVNGNGEIECGSRNRVLSETDDNAGFCKFAKNDESLQRFFKDHPDLRLYGEWLVPHTLRTYRENAWKKFYVFDVMRFDGLECGYLTYEEYKPLLEEYGILYVPPIAIVKNPSEQYLLDLLKKTGDFLIEDGKGLGEGLVIKNYAFSNRFGRKVWAKIVRTEFKEQHGTVPEVEIAESIETQIVNKYVTLALVEKEKAKIELDNGGWESKLIPKLLGVMTYSLISEETANFVKEFKYPVVDFKKLRSACERKTKELLQITHKG